jgi:flagellin
MRGQIRGLDKASRNAQDGISLIQTAEGALNETHAILQRMRELTVQAANDTNAIEDREAIGAEVTQLEAEITRIATTTEFNTKTLMSGAYETDGIQLQVGANSGQLVGFTIGDMTANGLSVSGIGSAIAGGVTTATALSAEITKVNDALSLVSKQRSELGAMQNRLEHTIKNLDTSSENLQASESRIRDVDMAKEMMEFTKNNILQQAAQAMLAQANQQPQGVLQLLR